MAVDSDDRRTVEPTSSFTIRRCLGTVVLSIRGQVELEDWSRINGILTDLIDDQGNLDVVVDLGEVTALERAAVPLIVHCARRAHSHGGRLRLADRACRDRSWLRPPGPVDPAPEDSALEDSAKGSVLAL